MASDLNSINLVGRLTRDPEMRTLPNGTAVAEIGLATNSAQKSGDSWEDYANFFNVRVFGKRAETLAKNCTKGDRIGVTGRLQQQRWEAENGGKRERVCIIADTFQFLNAPKGQGEQTEAAAPSSSAPF
jgi:single-strand DNA-binding protein